MIKVFRFLCKLGTVRAEMLRQCTYIPKLEEQRRIYTGLEGNVQLLNDFNQQNGIYANLGKRYILTYTFPRQLQLCAEQIQYQIGCLLQFR